MSIFDLEDRLYSIDVIMFYVKIPFFLKLHRDHDLWIQVKRIFSFTKYPDISVFAFSH